MVAVSDDARPYGGGSDDPTLKRVRIRHFQRAKQQGIKITGLTSYDFLSASIFDEAGIGSADAAAAQANPPNGEIGRLLGGEGQLQSDMGLDANAFFNMLSQVGNYGEIYDRNLNPVGLFREGSLNASFVDGGLIYAPPAR